MLDILKTVPPSADQWKIVIEGVRDSVDSWDELDSKFCSHETDSGRSYAPDYFDECWLCPLESDCQPTVSLYFRIGERDIRSMKDFLRSDSSHSKFLHMLPVLVTIAAPSYWWKELNACEFCSGRVIQLLPNSNNSLCAVFNPEVARQKFVLNGLYELAQKRTLMFDYGVLAYIYARYKNHRLSEWRAFCDWIRTLPYSELITGGNDEKDILGDTDA